MSELLTRQDIDIRWILVETEDCQMLQGLREVFDQAAMLAEMEKVATQDCTADATGETVCVSKNATVFCELLTEARRRQEDRQ